MATCDTSAARSTKVGEINQTISMTDRKENMIKLMDMLMESGKPGMTVQIAAGFAGNSWQESRWNPKAQYKNISYGLFQWQDSRLTRLKNFATEKHGDWLSVETQVQFLEWELINNKTQGLATWEIIKNMSDIEDITEVIARKFEVAGVLSLPDRKAAALAAYKTYIEARPKYAK